MAERYFETLRSVHGDAYVDRMLATKVVVQVESPALVVEPFRGHLEARDYYTSARG